MTLLFVEFWQHECCGDLFKVGDDVVWPVVPVEGDGLVSLLGADLGRQVRLSVERHQDGVGTLTGTVLSVRAVFHRLEQVTDHVDGTYHRALPGSARLRSITSTQRSEELDDLRWGGYVVEVRVQAERPGR